jgi:single-strand DNA-binding protein
MADLRMPDINSVMIVGNLIKDPIFRQTTTGTPVANFTIASNRKYKDSSGQVKEDVCFIGVVAWYKLAESCYENLKKGSAILVEGELQSRNWKTEDGFNRNVVEIKARRIQFLNKRDFNSGTYTPAEDQTEDKADADEVEKEQPTEEVEDQKDTESKDDTSDDPDRFDFGYRELKL